MKILYRPCSATRVTSPFSPARKHPITGRIEKHTGTDFAPIKKVHENIYAVNAGTVQVGSDNISGNYVKVMEDTKNYSFYCHLSKVLVKTGQKISAGTVVGNMGTTGNSTGEHLHFGIKKAGAWVDPLPYVKGLPIPPEVEEKEVIYNSVDELKGEWKQAIQWALEVGILKGDGKGLALKESEVKALVFIYRNEKRKDL